MHPLPPPLSPSAFPMLVYTLTTVFSFQNNIVWGEGEWVKRPLKLSIESLKGFIPSCFAKVSERYMKGERCFLHAVAPSCTKVIINSRLPSLPAKYPLAA